MGFNPFDVLRQRLSDDNDEAVADGGAVAAAEGGEASTDAPTARTDGPNALQATLETGENVMVELPEEVDAEAIAGAVDTDAEGFAGVEGQADSGTIIPVSTEDEDLDLSDTFFDSESYDFDFIQDQRIQDVRDKQISYNQRVGRWIMHKDDLVPSIKERIKGLIMGEDGLQVDPDDPDSEADQQLANHLEDVYAGEADMAPDVTPSDVIDDILDQNFMNARWVGRATDLRYLDLDGLELAVDGKSGERVYVQEATGYTTFQVDEDDPEDAIDFDTERSDPQALEVGEDVFDCQLYDRPPLEAVADDVVGKMEMKFLKARKAQIGSVGGLYIKVSPPEYLPEKEYFDRIEVDGEDTNPTKLEHEIQQGIDRAFSTLEEYKSGTVMAIPQNWEVEQVELPDNQESMDDQIRGYNEAIARRLLYPLDLVELKSGPELSRETLFRTVINTLQGWREEILTVFDDFAAMQREIHNLSGEVSHSFPAFENEDEELLVKALSFAGPAGMSEKEIRQALNSIEGFDLETDRDTSDMPPAGGPTDPQQRDQSMQEMLPDQSGGVEDGVEQPDQTPQGGSETVGQQQPASAMTAEAYTPPEGLDLYELEGWDQTSVWDAYLSLGGSHRTCSKRMATELRNADAWCAALKDQALGTDLWRKGQGALPEALEGGAAATVWAADPESIETGESLTAVADAVQEVTDADLQKLHEEDDFVAFSEGGVDPSGDEDVDEDEFQPVVVVDAGDQYDITGISASEADAVKEALAGGSGNAEARFGSGPLAHIDGVPSDPDVITRSMLQQWVKEVAEKKAKDADGLTVKVGEQYDQEFGEAADARSFSRKFEPTLHPRDPRTGQFVERPFDFDLTQRALDNASTPELLQFLQDEGEPVDRMIAGNRLSIDGIPEDANSLDEARELLEDGADGMQISEDDYVSRPDTVELRLSEADEVEALHTADEGELGAAAENMDVAHYDDHDAYVKQYRETIDGPRSQGEKPTLAEREIAADNFLRNLGYSDNVPDQFYNSEERYMSSEALEGDHLRGATPAGADNVDSEEFRRFLAAILLAGNSDMHGDNMIVREDGSFAAIDLNKSGGDFTTPGKFRSRGVMELTGQANAVGIDMGRDDLQAEAEDLAAELDLDAALQGVENSDLSGQAMHQFRDNIKANIEAFRAGEVDL